MIRSAVPVILAALTLTGSAVPCHAAEWSYSAGGGVASGYEFDGYHVLGTTGLGMLAIQRNLNPTLGLRAEVGYLGYVGNPRAGSSFPADVRYAYEPEQVRADLVPLMMGFRWSSPFGGSGIGVYLDFMPTMTLALWKGRREVGMYQDSTWSTRREESSFTRLVPGLAAGLGLRFRASDRWQIDYGVRHLSTARMGQGLYPSEGHYSGLRSLALAAALSWTASGGP